MKYQHISGREADKNRRLGRDMQSAKRHKDLRELHEFREHMRKGAEDANKINELRRIEGYLAHLQPGSRIREIKAATLGGLSIFAIRNVQPLSLSLLRESGKWGGI